MNSVPTNSDAKVSDANSPFTHLPYFQPPPKAMVEVKAPMISDLRTDFADMPSAAQLRGSFVKLKFAPGQNINDEDVLPVALVPPKKGATGVEIMDYKLWNEMSGKIHVTAGSLNKYKRWIQGASLALAKVKEQLAHTQQNKLVLEKGLEAMKYQRLQILKRLKSYKLKRDLDAATKRMKKLKEYSDYLSKNKKSLTGHRAALQKRLDVVNKTLQTLKEKHEDPPATVTP